MVVKKQDEAVLHKILEEEFWHPLWENAISNGSKYIISFSGLPRSGKSTLAAELKQRYNALGIEKDHGRRILRQHPKVNSEDDIEKVLANFLTNHYLELKDHPNQLIVLESSVDRRIDEIRKWANHLDKRVYIINVETDRSIIEERVRSTLSQDQIDYFIANMDEWSDDHQRFLQNNTPDFTINNNSDFEKQILIEELDRLL